MYDFTRVSTHFSSICTKVKNARYSLRGKSAVEPSRRLALFYEFWPEA